MSERSEGYSDGYAAGLRFGKKEGDRAAAEALRELHRLQDRIREVKAAALRVASAQCSNVAFGSNADVAEWLLDRADRIGSEARP